MQQKAFSKRGTRTFVKIRRQFLVRRIKRANA